MRLTHQPGLPFQHRGEEMLGNCRLVLVRVGEHHALGKVRRSNPIIAGERRLIEPKPCALGNAARDPAADDGIHSLSGLDNRRGLGPGAEDREIPVRAHFTCQKVIAIHAALS